MNEAIAKVTHGTHIGKADGRKTLPVLSPALIFLLLFLGFQAGRPAHSGDLGTLIDRGLGENLGLKIKALRIEEARLDIRKARNSFVPNVDFSLSDSQKFALDDAQKKIQGLEGKTVLYSLGLTQAFPALGKANTLQCDLSELKKAAAETVRTRTALEFMKQISRVFFQLLKQQELIKINQENLRLIGVLLEIAKINMEVGLALRNDILRIEVQQANIEASLVKEKSTFQNLLFDLAALLNADDPSQTRLHLPPSLKYPLFEISASEAKALLLERDLDLALAKSDIAILEKTSQAAKSAHLPTLNLGGKYNYGREVSLLRDTRDYSVYFSLTAPVFDSGDLNIEVERIRKNLEMAKLVRKELENDKKATLSKALGDYDEVRNRIAFAEKALEQSRENMRVVATRYQTGDASIVELVDAQITLTNSAQTAVNAYYDERVRGAEIFLLTNQPDRLKTLDEGAIPVPADWEYLARNISSASGTADLLPGLALATASEEVELMSPMDASAPAPVLDASGTIPLPDAGECFPLTNASEPLPIPVPRSPDEIPSASSTPIPPEVKP